jgi:hypothetical protein
MKTLWDPPPGIQASGSRSAARLGSLNRTTVLGGKGSLRRRKADALAPCAPLCTATNRDGRLRREPDAQPFLRLRKDENQCGVDKTS